MLKKYADFISVFCLHRESVKQHSGRIISSLLSFWEKLTFFCCESKKTGAKAASWKDQGFSIDYTGQGQVLCQCQLVLIVSVEKKMKSRKKKKFILRSCLVENRWMVEVGASCRQKGGVGICSLELSWRLAVQCESSTRPQGSAGRQQQLDALSDWLFSLKTFSFLHSRQLICPQNVNQGTCSQKREWQWWVLQAA